MASDALIEKPSHSRLPLLDLGIDWGSGWDEFRSSFREALCGPKPDGDESVSGGPDLRIEWIRLRRPDWSFAAAILVHVALIWLAVLPIWAWLPQPDHNLAPLQIEWTWYPPQDLHPIRLPASAAQALRRADRAAASQQHADPPAAPDAVHPRQTILSLPVRLTHPRQTLIQPKAPAEAPKIVQQMPNIVEWAPAQPDLRPTFSAVITAPRARQRHDQNTSAPDMNLQRESASLNIPAPQDPALKMPGASAAAPVARAAKQQTTVAPEVNASAQSVNLATIAPTTEPELKMPAAPASAASARVRRPQDVAAPDVAGAAPNASLAGIAPASEPKLQIPVAPAAAAAARTRHQQETAAPIVDVSSEGTSGDLRRIVALSATPAPPAPEVKVPQGNLAAKIAISPDAAKSGSGDSSSAVAKGSASAAAASGPSSLPAAIQISGGASHPQTSAGLAPPANLAARPAPRSATPAAPTPEPAIAARTAPPNFAMLAPGTPPEKILSGKEVGTLHLNTPNMSSTRGSWVMHFAQLDEDPRPMYRPKGELAGPLPITTVDPRYPPETIAEHISGEVVLYAIVRKDGSIDSIQVAQSLDPRLDKSAVDALARWKFNPGTRAGTPVDVEAVIHVPFEYRERY
jgi:TonB family protein